MKRTDVERPWKHLGGFIATVALVVLAFLATTTVLLIRLHGAADASVAITGGAVPSIDELTRAHSALTTLHVRTGRYLAAERAEPAGREEVLAATFDLRRHMSAYLALPSYPGERVRWRELLSSIDAVTATTHQILLLDRVDRAAARARLPDLEVAVERAGDRLFDAARVNAAEILRFTDEIEAIRSTTTQAAIVLNGVCVILAGVLLARAVRAARRQRQIEARYAELLRERADEMELFAARVAHDLLSPLSSTSVTLAHLAESADDHQRRLVARGQRGVAKVQATVDGLLEFARAGARAEGETVRDAAEVTRDAVASVQEAADAAGVTIEIRAEPGLAVAASAGVLLSVVTNLVQNAIKYIGDGRERVVTVTLARRGERVRIEVRDTGPGIPPELVHRVFEPYFRVSGNPSGGGLGLGLATVKRLVEAHGGTVSAASAPGGGAVLSVELPGAAPASDAAASAPGP